MKNAPNSKSNLDRALQRFAGDFARANDLRGQMANAIVAQMIGEGVVKGGSGLRFRYGEKLTRVTMDLDTCASKAPWHSFRLCNAAMRRQAEVSRRPLVHRSA